MGTRHLNLLFFLPEGENPFPSQPFLKRNFDLVNPEAWVFISSTASVYSPAVLQWSYSGAPFCSFASQALQCPLGWKVAPKVLGWIGKPFQSHPSVPKIIIT